MKKLILSTILFFSFMLAQSQDWHAKRITNSQCQDESNTWMNFRKDFELETVPGQAIAKIATDSKYWLWVNGEMAVFEGQLKRGPNPNDTYYDEVDIAPFLKNGKNTIAVLTWYFGKDGFSHKSSGQAGLVFQCDELGLNSDASWRSRLDKGFENTGRPYPNFRQPESNVRFDARTGSFDWVLPGAMLKGFGGSRVIGEAESAPWNKLIKRPIPLWKNYGLKEYANMPSLPFISTGDTIVCKLPYNAQITPWFKIESEDGEVIEIRTDHYYGGSEPNVRAEYVTTGGIQEYESLGWMNGHHVRYYFPKGIKILGLKYRETGYNTEFTGSFKCNDPFYNKLWKKAARTLYVTMRDTYMDCPDRERAQWWGDVVNESGETFYALSPSSSDITKKGMLELINWQREDSTIYSPVPSGTWDRELPGQMLASIGYYGFWNYYQNTGDKETIAKIYEGVKKYLGIWKLKADGTLTERTGGWYWGDWGEKPDKHLLVNAWYYLALKGYLNMSELLGEKEEAIQTKQEMEEFKAAFNSVFWDGNGYRTAEYEGEYDDRAQALAVVSGLADEAKHKKLFKIFQTTFLSSPYMEKYVIEALFQMGYDEYGLERLKERFSVMVNDKERTTLYEGWGIGKEGFGGGSANHAWSGGGLTILSQYVCGLAPLEPAWKTFQVKPQLGNLEYAETGNETIAGKVAVKVEKSKSGIKINLTVPEGSEAVVYIPEGYKKITVNDVAVFNKKFIENKLASFKGKDSGFNCVKLKGGKYNINAY